MKPFNNYKETQALSEGRKLPVGGYICKIMGAEVVKYDWGEVLEISIDITEGEYKDFYAQDYRSQTAEDKKWKGKLRIFVPKDDGSERDGLTKSIFKGNIEAIEESNSGYSWDWDETKLKDKTTGVLFRNEEWEYNGKSGWKAQPFKAIPIELIKSGKFTLPKDKPLANKSTSSAVSSSGNDFSSFEEVVGDKDLPF